MNPLNIITISVALTEPTYSVCGYWEDITTFPNKTELEIREILSERYKTRHPSASRITITFPSK